jgi:hypothetical protein
MSQLSERMLSALDEAVAQEVGVRLRQAALNLPSTGSAPTLPDHFEQGLQRLKMLHAQAKILVGKTFGDAVGRALSTDAIGSLSALQAPGSLASTGTARHATRESKVKHGMTRRRNKRAMRKKSDS